MTKEIATPHAEPDPAGPSGLDPGACERARLSRDPRFDGRWFIGVTSTGIYCRPICPARAPKREHVVYYPTAAAAAEHGLRPCLRCRPEASPGSPAWRGTSATVARALRLIADGAVDRDGVEGLASTLGVSSRHLVRLFRDHLGASPSSVARTRRIHFAKRLIDETDLGMTEIATAAAFGSVRRFNAAIRDVYDRSPTELRRTARRGHRAQSTRSARLRLTYRPPFHWEGLLGFLGARAIPGVEEVSDGVYRRTFEIDGQRGRVSVRTATPGSVELSLDAVPPRCLFAVAEKARRLFDLEADPSEIGSTLALDAGLANLVGRAPGLRVPGCWDGFELAVRAILGQQVSVVAARTLAGRLVERWGDAVDVAGPGPSRLFPSAEVLSGAEIEKAGMPGARAEAVRRLAAEVHLGRIAFDGTLSLEEFTARMTALPGVGPWTAHYVAMRALGEPDAFLPTDLGVLRAATAVLGVSTPAELARRSEPWRPWRSYAVMYLWRALEG